MGSDSEQASVFAVMVVPPLEPTAPDADSPSRPRGSSTPNSTPAAATPDPDASLIVVGRTPPPSGLPGGSESSPVIPAELKVSTILDGVYGAGAAPAWSPDGQALAFSAMPSDRSRGPDLYVWRVGDERARPITSDHGSYFASWSGSIIVVSRATRASGDAFGNAAPVVQTVGIDQTTYDERTIAAEGLWLPQVDPFSRRAVAWSGRLAWEGQQVVPTHGALYLIDWQAVDPFAASQGPQPTPDGGDVDHAGRGGATAASTERPNVGPEAPPPSPAATEGPVPTATPQRPRAPIATDSPTPRPLDERLTPIEPERDVLQHPVTDWRVMWSADARTLGLWIGDVPSTVWGHLTVLSLDLQGRLDHESAILGSTLAKRGFTLGSNRVAWVAPLGSSPSGELRLRMWNGDSVREVRVRPVQSTGVVAAF